jgi:hypothetical protein
MTGDRSALSASDVKQHGTHRELTGQAQPGSAGHTRLNLDAIVVPGSRPAANLDHAVTLARAARCWLLIVCSQQLRGSEVKEFLAARSFRKAIVIELPPGYWHELLEFPALRFIEKEMPDECNFYSTDLSLKRNIGLVLAKMLGWRRIFFLDDDIRDITYPDLQATVDMLEPFPAVGMRVTDFPDNSIVCHANRETEGSQDVFVSGAALAVRCSEDIGFFPDIYNEDWLFFFDDASRGRLANSYLEATQLTYYPFANAKRAAWQEFGDVLAEGLYSLLHIGLNVGGATPEYWTKFLRARRRFLEAILARSKNADLEIRAEVVASVEAALESLKEIKPEFCARYIQAWRADLRLWKQRMDELSAAAPLSLEDALKRLRLSSTATADRYWRVRPNWDEPKTAVMAGPVPIPQIDTIKEIGTLKELAGATSGPPTMPISVGPDPRLRPTHETSGRHRKRRDKAKQPIIWGRLVPWSARRPQVGAFASPDALASVMPPGPAGPPSPEAVFVSRPERPLVDIRPLHKRLLVSDCMSAACFRGEGRRPSPRS